MLRILILDEDDIDVKPFGFNVALVHNDEFELIVQHTAVPKLLEQLVSWYERQDEVFRERYLQEKQKFDLGFDIEAAWRKEANKTAD